MSPVRRKRVPERARPGIVTGLAWTAAGGILSPSRRCRQKAAARSLSIHVPDCATPKGGPSAGIILTTALASQLTGCAVQKILAALGGRPDRDGSLSFVKGFVFVKKRRGFTAFCGKVSPFLLPFEGGAVQLLELESAPQLRGVVAVMISLGSEWSCVPGAPLVSPSGSQASERRLQTWP